MMTSKAPITWLSNVRHFFSVHDASCMFAQSAGAIDLTDHESVKRNAWAILTQVEAGHMPPLGGGPPWTRERIKMFREWIGTGRL